MCLAAARRLPASVGYALVDALALPLVVLSAAREKLVGRGVRRNLRIAYRDELSVRETRRIQWAWARHMLWLGVDFVHMPDIQKDNLSRHVDLSEWDRVDKEYRRGKGVICVTGHIGVPELLGHVASLQGIPTVGVFSTGAPAVDTVMAAIRSSGGQRVLPKAGAVWPLKKTLDRGEAIGLAADENTRKNPVFVPFLGTLAATSTTPALLHLSTGAPIVVATIHRVGRLRYRLHVWDVITRTEAGDRRAELEVISRKMNAALSRAIRAYPAQWFWGSRRFYTRPEGEVAGMDGIPPSG
jgi:KDO2-lipid IV(A) lauroyltransferase